MVILLRSFARIKLKSNGNVFHIILDYGVSYLIMYHIHYIGITQCFVQRWIPEHLIFYSGGYRKDENPVFSFNRINVVLKLMFMVGNPVIN